MVTLFEHLSSMERVLQIGIAKDSKQLTINGQFVVFTLGNEKYGIEISYVKEIMKWTKPTKLPGMLDEISGVIKLRDQVIPLISLRRQCGLPEAEKLAETKIIILELDTVFLGVNVDDVAEVVNVPGSAMEFPSGLTAKSHMVQGIAKMEEYLLILIDTKALFTKDLADQIDHLEQSIA